VFIYVVTLVPGLFLDLQSKAIDYDAVAYRTGVILVEDPGAAGPVSGSPCFGVSNATGSAWESQPDKCDMTRFGLAISKDTPNILSPLKVTQFFNNKTSDNSTLAYPEDYQSRAIFGDYPYQFNISFQMAGSNITQSVGAPLPDGYGYIRRPVKLKGTSNATIGIDTITNFGYQSKDNVTNDYFSIHLNCTKLLGDVTNPAYQIDPLHEQIMVNITDLERTGNKSPTFPTVTTELHDITIYRSKPLPPDPHPQPATVSYYDPALINTSVDNIYTPVSGLPKNIANNVSLVFSPGFFKMADRNTQMYVVLHFMHFSPEDRYLNNTWFDYDVNNYLTLNTSRSFDYNYTSVTQPTLQDGVLEVAVW
jgi:hypothetical protein